MATGIRIGESLAPLAAGCGMITGCVALLAGALALLSGEFVGAGVCLGAAAIAFGSIANAVLRS